MFVVDMFADGDAVAELTLEHPVKSNSLSALPARTCNSKKNNCCHLYANKLCILIKNIYNLYIFNDTSESVLQYNPHIVLSNSFVHLSSGCEA